MDALAGLPYYGDLSLCAMTVDQAAAYAADVEWEATKTDNENAKQACIDAGMQFVALDHDELLEATKDVYETYDAQYGSLLEMMGKK